jgi:hypothetical protein
MARPTNLTSLWRSAITSNPIPTSSSPSASLLRRGLSSSTVAAATSAELGASSNRLGVKARKLRMIILGAPVSLARSPPSLSVALSDGRLIQSVRRRARGKERRRNDCSRVSHDSRSVSYPERAVGSCLFARCAEWDIKTVGVGDLLRQEIIKGTELGRKAEGVMKAGSECCRSRRGRDRC